MNPLSTPATEELAGALAGLGKPDGLSVEEAAAAEAEAARLIALHNDHLKQHEAMVALHCREVDGVKRIHLPVGTRMPIMKRVFTVKSISRREIVMTVPIAPRDLTQGRVLELYGGRFRVDKITLPQRMEDGVRFVLVPANGKTAINPKPVVQTRKK